MRLTENKHLNNSTKYEVYLNNNVEHKQAGESNYTLACRTHTFQKLQPDVDTQGHPIGKFSN